MDESNTRRLTALEFEVRQANTAVIKAVSHAQRLTTDDQPTTLYRLQDVRTVAASAAEALVQLGELLQRIEHLGMGPEHAGWCAGPSAHVLTDLG